MDIAKTFIKEETTFCHVIHENPYLQVKVQVFKNTYTFTHTHTLPAPPPTEERVLFQPFT